LKEELSAETGRLREQKEAMQRAIAARLEQRDTLRREVAVLQAELDNLQVERDSGLSLNAELSGAVEQLKNAITATSAEVERLRLEKAGLLSDIEGQEQSNREAGKRIKEARSRLDELREEAEQAGFARLEEKIREVYALLPQDQADAACR
jgi:chromosome segregation ATPase